MLDDTPTDKFIFTSFLQAAWRGYLARAELELQGLAALRIQSSWRMYVARRYYLDVRDKIVLLQSHARGILARRRFVRQCLMIKYCALNMKCNVNEKILKLKRLQFWLSCNCTTGF